MALFEAIYGATPIDDLSELIPSHIQTRDELNEWESANIIKAARRYLTKRAPQKISLEWLKQVHQEMFGETWRWAGQLRQRNLTIGTDWHNLPEQLKLLVDDLQFWQKEAKDISLFSQGVRLPLRPAKIHPFINGNGRYARLVSDIFLFNQGAPLPIWPNNKMIEETGVRIKYIEALQAADKNDYSLLEAFIAKLLPKRSD